MSADFIKTMNAAWARGRVTLQDLTVFKEAGAEIPHSMAGLAGLGFLTMDWLIDHWKLTAEADNRVRGSRPDQVIWDEVNKTHKLAGAPYRWGRPKFAYDEVDHPDQVDHPDHYKAGGMETIDIIDAYVSDPVSFALGNVIKYVTRAGRKTGETATKDLAKARWYLDHALTHLGETK